MQDKTRLASQHLQVSPVNASVNGQTTVTCTAVSCRRSCTKGSGHATTAPATLCPIGAVCGSTAAQQACLSSIAACVLQGQVCTPHSAQHCRCSIVNTRWTCTPWPTCSARRHLSHVARWVSLYQCRTTSSDTLALLPRQMDTNPRAHWVPRSGFWWAVSETVQRRGRPLVTANHHAGPPPLPRPTDAIFVPSKGLQLSNVGQTCK